MLLKSYKSSRSPWKIALLSLFFVFISGCSSAWLSPGKLIGQNEQTVIAEWGNPTARIAMPDGGIRLQYSGQPWGRYVWNVDMAPNDEVYEVYQALQPNYFNKIPVDGSWRDEDVLREFGAPAFIDHTASWHGDIWNYRWRENTTDMFFYIYFDENGAVKRAHQGIDFSSEERFPFVF